MNTVHVIYDSLDKKESGPHKIGTTLLIAVSTCFISLICAMVLWSLDIRRRKMIQEDAPAGPCKIEKMQREEFSLLFHF